MFSRAASVALALLSLWQYATCVEAFREGEFITSARKSQYHEVRTQWHDLLGNHCPRFGQDRMVAMPLPKPHIALDESKDSYKIQLSFDGDRYLTPWLRVLGPSAPLVPVIEVGFRRAGEELLGVSAKVLGAPIAYQHVHSALVSELKNSSQWPKHLLVRYRFKAEHEVDLDRGLYLIIALGLSTLVVLVINAASGAHTKLAQFLQEMTADEPGAGGGANGGAAAGSAATFALKGISKAE